jgi:hypothetical protein
MVNPDKMRWLLFVCVYVSVVLHDDVTDTSVDLSSRNFGISVVNEVSGNKQVVIRTICWWGHLGCTIPSTTLHNSKSGVIQESD